MYIGYPDAEETDCKSRGGGRCIIVSTIPNHLLFTAYYNLHKHLEHNTIYIQHSSRTQHSSLKPSTTTVLKVGPSIYFRLLLNQIRYWNADKNTSTRPGHETSRDKTGPGPGTSRGLAGGSRDISRHYRSGPEMSRDFLPSSECTTGGMYKNIMNWILEYKGSI